MAGYIRSARYSGNIELKALAADNSTYVSLPAVSKLTANGCIGGYAAAGQFELVVTTATSACMRSLRTCRWTDFPQLARAVFRDVLSDFVKRDTCRGRSTVRSTIASGDRHVAPRLYPAILPPDLYDSTASRRRY